MDRYLRVPLSEVVSNGISRSPIPTSLSTLRTSPWPPYGPLGCNPILVSSCGHSVGANWRSLGIGPASISLLDLSNPRRCPGKNCPNKSGNHPLPPGIVAPLE